MPQQMDDELLQQAQAGEESAIAALITAMMPAIRKGAALDKCDCSYFTV